MEVNYRDQMRQVPVAVAARLRELNGIGDAALAETRALYIPTLQELSTRGLRVVKDVAYGPNERQRLDIHIPEAPADRPMPVVLFFHGGGLVGGHKNAVGDLVYGNIANEFARHGIIGINATYRLAPAHPWPAGAQDVGAAVSWARENVGEYGGDPSRLFVFGHSAGATHVAAFALHRELDPGPRAGVAGIVLTSGVYSAKGGAANNVAYYGADESVYGRRSTLGNLTWGGFEVFLSAAEHEPLMFQSAMAQLLDELVRVGGRMPRFKLLLDHNHFSQTLSFGTSDRSLSAEIIDFVGKAVAS